jgi:hypothetical protein
VTPPASKLRDIAEAEALCSDGIDFEEIVEVVVDGTVVVECDGVDCAVDGDLWNVLLANLASMLSPGFTLDVVRLPTGPVTERFFKTKAASLLFCFCINVGDDGCDDRCEADTDLDPEDRLDLLLEDPLGL